MNQQEFPEDLIPLAKAAGLVPGTSRRGGVDPSTVFRWVTQGKLQSWKVGGRRHVSRAEVLAFVRRETRAPASPHRATVKAESDRQTDEILKRFGLEGY